MSRNASPNGSPSRQARTATPLYPSDALTGTLQSRHFREDNDRLLRSAGKSEHTGSLPKPLEEYRRILDAHSDLLPYAAKKSRKTQTPTRMLAVGTDTPTLSPRDQGWKAEIKREEQRIIDRMGYEQRMQGIYADIAKRKAEILRYARAMHEGGYKHHSGTPQKRNKGLEGTKDEKTPDRSSSKKKSSEGKKISRDYERSGRREGIMSRHASPHSPSYERNQNHDNDDDKKPRIWKNGIPPRTFEEISNDMRRGKRRKHTYAHLVFNMFLQTAASIALPKNPIRVYFTNHSRNDIVMKCMLSRNCVELTKHPTDANILCTHDLIPKHKCTEFIKGVSYHVKNLADTCPLTNMDFSSPQRLSEELGRIKLFRFDSQLVKSSFETLSRHLKLTTYVSDHTFMASCVPGTWRLTRKINLAATIMEFARMKHFDAFKIIPKTFLVTSQNYTKDMAELKNIVKAPDHFKGPWIVKPGYGTDGGKGINMAYEELELVLQCQEIFKQMREQSSIVVQNYMRYPLLYDGRKFDVRVYALVVRSFKKTNVYWYREGYLNLSSFPYNPDDRGNPLMHITSEKIQRMEPASFGHHEPLNRVYFNDAEKYFDKQEEFREQAKTWHKNIVRDIKSKVLLCFEATLADICKDSNHLCFELIEMSLLVDAALNVWLLDATSNLDTVETDSPRHNGYLKKMIDDTLAIVIDPVYGLGGNKGSEDDEYATDYELIMTRYH
jgi:hypothetical protein